jgi:penicillin-binding protein 1A
VYVYSAALERALPFDTILDAPFTTMSGGQPYSPHNYDEKFEGVITLRRALDGSRNVPAVKLAEKIGMNGVIDMARRFGITSPLPPYLPITLGAADLNLLEHTSAFTVFPNDGIRIDPHMIRRVTTYDGALLEQAHPLVHDVIEPDVARTMTSMLHPLFSAHGHACVRPGLPRRSKDQHDERFHRRVVHRVHSGSDGRGVGRLRR